MSLYVCKQTFCKLYGYITQKFLRLRERNFQGSIFISITTYREIFRSALVYLKVSLNKKQNSQENPSAVVKVKVCRNKETPTQLFSCEFCKNFKKTFFKEHLRVTASAPWSLILKNCTLKAFTKRFWMASCKYILI